MVKQIQIARRKYYFRKKYNNLMTSLTTLLVPMTMIPLKLPLKAARQLTRTEVCKKSFQREIASSTYIKAWTLPQVTDKVDYHI